MTDDYRPPWGIYHKLLYDVLLSMDRNPAAVHVADQSWSLIKDRMAQVGINLSDDATQFVFLSGMQFMKEHTVGMLHKLDLPGELIEQWFQIAHAAQAEFAGRMVTSWDRNRREAAGVSWPQRDNPMYKPIMPVYVDDGEDDDDDGAGVVE